ncbi:hypothetical protein [Burkholderia sp. LMG 13014]|uniref:hypothetical protein n=1 Tax=Burkholderia sp. LMG 13014 TaxID=2709306 RepID=UPI0019666A5D|nr:hypothetical protein [Burkholderia sp. LMG 13014]
MTTDKRRADALTAMADDMRAEQTYLGSCREACDNSGRIRWDRLQRVIDHLTASPVEQHEAAPVYIGCADPAWRAKHEAAPADAKDAMDTLVAVLNAIGYTEEFATTHPDLKVSEGVKLFLSQQTQAAPDDAVVGVVAREQGYWNRGHFYEGERKVIITTKELQDAPIGAKLYVSALEGTGNGADDEYQVSIDVRDLFAYLRAAWREGQHYDREDTPDQADSWSAASDYANKTIDRWTSMQPIVSRAPRTEVAGAVPEGWKLVPCVPTEGMKSAALRADDRWRQPGDQLLVQWDAMLAAVPPSPSADAAAAGKEMAEVTIAEFETAIETLRHVIDCLRQTGSYTDEEGEATDFLEPLLDARLAAPQPPSADAAAAPADAEAAFDAFAARYDHDSNEWLDMDAQQTFIHGWQARAAASQPALSDAAITACALMIKGICITQPNEEWVSKIEARIRFMLDQAQTEKGNHDE